MNIVLSIIIGYLLGSIPNALLIGKLLYNIDVRMHGSGNLGGSNTGRVLGAKAGMSVMLLDVLKVVLALFIVYSLYHDINCLLVCSIFANIGHCYPVFAGFKGGKAVSTFMGYLISISVFVYYDCLFYVLPIVVFFIVLYITKIVSISSILASLSISLYIYIKLGLCFTFITTLCLSLFLIYRHRSNIGRLLNNNENKIKWM